MYDFSKAFEKLKFEVLLSRLSECSVPSDLMIWISSYLKDRRQSVCIGNVRSDPVRVSSGVPQGSVLAPYLFSIVTGSFDISHLSCCVIKYADDFTICVPLFLNGANEHVLEAHRALVEWSRRKGLELNLSKCKALAVKRSEKFSPVSLPGISFVDELKLLGVTFDAKGNWSRHIDRIVRSASRNLFVVRSVRGVLSSEALILVYNGLVRSIIEYCSPLFVGLSEENSAKLERIQVRFHRIMCGKNCARHVFQELRLRRRFAAIRLFNEAADPHHILHRLLPQQSRSGRMLLPSTRFERRLRSFFVKTALIVNEQQSLGFTPPIPPIYICIVLFSVLCLSFCCMSQSFM